MRRFYVSLFNGLELYGQKYDRGEIVIADGPPLSMGWAQFQPMPRLEGAPEILAIEEAVAGTFIFRYRIEESDQRFATRARLGLPMATCVEDTEGDHGSLSAVKAAEDHDLVIDAVCT